MENNIFFNLINIGLLITNILLISVFNIHFKSDIFITLTIFNILGFLFWLHLDFEPGITIKNIRSTFYYCCCSCSYCCCNLYKKLDEYNKEYNKEYNELLQDDNHISFCNIFCKKIEKEEEKEQLQQQSESIYLLPSQETSDHKESRFLCKKKTNYIKCIDCDLCFFFILQCFYCLTKSTFNNNHGLNPYTREKQLYNEHYFPPSNESENENEYDSENFILDYIESKTVKVVKENGIKPIKQNSHIILGFIEMILELGLVDIIIPLYAFYNAVTSKDWFYFTCFLTTTAACSLDKYLHNNKKYSLASFCSYLNPLGVIYSLIFHLSHLSSLKIINYVDCSSKLSSEYVLLCIKCIVHGRLPRISEINKFFYDNNIDLRVGLKDKFNLYMEKDDKIVVKNKIKESIRIVYLKYENGRAHFDEEDYEICSYRNENIVNRDFEIG